MNSIQSIARHKTAMQRYALSRPLVLATSHRLITPDSTVFDYGCGRGADVRLLRKTGVRANGWDPHFLPDEKLRTADCVNLGYVLNVIENQKERDSTLRKAFGLAQKCLIASVRVDNALNDAEEFADGVLTKAGAFQKLYSQEEFKQYLEAVLGRRPHMASLGIAYIFTDERLESEYLANLAIYRPRIFRESVIEQFKRDRLAQRYLSKAKALGRPPLDTEFKLLPKLVERFGPPQRIERIASALLDQDSLTRTREDKRESILTYIAMMRLQGMTPPPLRTLPGEIQADIKMLWRSYKAALQAGTDFLFQLGKQEMVKKACGGARLGKRLPEDFYVHKSAEIQLPPLLRLLIFAARQVVGEIEYDIVKISLDGRKVSFLRYRDFETVAHPDLVYSVKVYLPTSSYSIRNYDSAMNPPILHRKETLLDPLHPQYSEFANLSTQEEQCGLLSRSDIGTREGWQSVLRERGFQIVGHSLVTNLIA